MNKIPDNFYRYKQMPIWTAETLPDAVKTMHNTKAGVYGKINIIKGKLKYTAFKSENGEIDYEVILSTGDVGISAPQQYHKVEALSDDLAMFLEFFQEKNPEITAKERVFKMIFPEKSPHNEVKMLTDLMGDISGKKALDIGSGLGRNALWLAKQGAEVTCYDRNIDGLEETYYLAKKNNLKINIEARDLNETIIEENFDIIISTVCLQFLEKDSAKKLLESAIEKTNPGGYNLIIVPIDAPDMACPFDFFPNVLTYEDYLNFYKDWNILYQDNMIGHFHRKDENGHPAKSRFATIIAQKPQN